MKHSFFAVAVACGLAASLAGCSDDSNDGRARDAGDAGGGDARAPTIDAAAASDGSASATDASGGVDAGVDAVVAGPKPGSLDLGFGNSGMVQTSLVDGTDALQAVLALPDGKLLVAGSGAGSAVFARYTAAGELDPAFSDDGVLVKAVSGATSTVIQALSLASNGDVIAVGYTDTFVGRDVVLMRLRTDGTLDPTFGTSGVAHPDFGAQEAGFDAIVRSDGKILVVGSSSESGGRMMLARYTSSGAADASLFGTGMITFPLGTNGYARKLALTSPTTATGKIVLAGSSGGAAEVLQLDSDAAPDPSFGVGGRARIDVTALDDQTSGMALDGAGRIVVVGQVGASDPPADTFVLRLTPQGVLDTSFNLSGKAVLTVSADVDAPNAGVVVDALGRIIIAGRGFWGGSAEVFALRLATDGNRDTTFGSGGVTRVSSGNGIVPEAIALDLLGRIVLAGFADTGMLDSAVVRLTP